MSSPDPIFFLFYGLDEPRLRDALDHFVTPFEDDATAGMNISRLPGRSISIVEIEGAASTLPFLADLRLILVDNLTLNPKAVEGLDQLSEILPGLPDWCRIGFIETGLSDTSNATQSARRRKTSRKQLLKKLVNIIEKDPRGKVQVYNEPKNDGDRVRWIADRAARYGAEVDNQAASELGKRLGDNLNLVDMELAKLSVYTLGERAITKADVELLTPYTTEANIFYMVDALAQRNGKQAALLFKQLMDDGEEPLRIFSLFVRQYRMLLIMKEGLDNGLSPGNAASTLGVKQWLAEKLSKQARLYTLPQLERIYRMLLEIDLDIKTGKQSDNRLAMEMLIARLARAKK